MFRTRSTRSFFGFALFALAAVAPLSAAAQEKPQQPVVTETPQPGRSYIDLVIALDTSNSMDGLINAARQKLWDIVNDLATAKPTPILRVGVISFGNDGYRDEGWTRVDVPLTDDLDLVNEKLMALTTNGGSEYVGRAIKVALDDMQWRKDKNTLKMIFVAGNESADQDQKFRSMEQAARSIQNDVIVNTIYCGNDNQTEATGWRDVAQRADGQFAAIAQDGGVVAIATPYDQKLNDLSAELNKTYIAYGAEGEVALNRQAASDKSAQGLSSGAGAGRAAAKASRLYNNARWDLVDATGSGGGASVESIAADDLPSNMQKMSVAERKKYVEDMRKKRESIQNEIQTVNKQREAFIQKETAKNKGKKEDAFDVAVKKTIRKQAAAKNISFE